MNKNGLIIEILPYKTHSQMYTYNTYVKTMYLEVKEMKDTVRCEVCWMTFNLKFLSKKVLDSRKSMTVNSLPKLSFGI